MPTTTRGAIPYPLESDVPDVPVDMQELAERLAAIIAIDAQGPLGSRPAPGNAGTFYTDTSTGITYRDDGTTWRALNAPSGAGVPTGAVLAIPSSIAPSGYLALDGAAYSRTTYAALYAFLGGGSSPFGQGDGSSTFNVPDYRGRPLVGLGTDSNVNAIGKNDGKAVGVRSPVHTHAHTLTLPSHTHVDNIGITIPSLTVNTSGLVTAAHSHGGFTGNENNTIGVVVGSDPTFVASRAFSQHPIAADAVAIQGTAVTNPGVGVKTGSIFAAGGQNITGAIGSNTDSYSTVLWCIKT